MLRVSALQFAVRAQRGDALLHVNVALAFAHITVNGAHRGWAEWTGVFRISAGRCWNNDGPFHVPVEWNGRTAAASPARDCGQTHRDRAAQQPPSGNRLLLVHDDHFVIPKFALEWRLY